MEMYPLILTIPSFTDKELSCFNSVQSHQLTHLKMLLAINVILRFGLHVN